MVKMRMKFFVFILFIIFNTFSAFAQVDLKTIDLNTIGQHIDDESVLYEKNDLYNLYLINKECNFTDNDFYVPSLSELERGIQIVKDNIAKDIVKIQSIAKEIDKEFYENVEASIFPINIMFSINGLKQCENAGAGYDSISIPLPYSIEDYNVVIDAFSHEFGHVYQNRMESHRNVFSEATADMFTILFHNGTPHISYMGESSKLYYHEDQEFLNTYNELGADYFLSKYPTATENSLEHYIQVLNHSNCNSESFLRDFTDLKTLKGPYLNGNDIYNISCWLNSAIYNVSDQNYTENVKSFLRHYINNSELYNGHDLESIVGKALPALNQLTKTKIIEDNHSRINLKKNLNIDEFNNKNTIVLLDSIVDFSLNPAFVVLKLNDLEISSFTYTRYEDEEDEPGNMLLNLYEVDSDISKFDFCLEEETKLSIEISNYSLKEKAVIKYNNSNSLVIDNGCYSFSVL